MLWNTAMVAVSHDVEGRLEANGVGGPGAG